MRASEVFRTLIDAGVVEIEEDENGDPDYYVTMDLPEDFALDQPLSPFLLAALELLDPESETYTYDIISMVEATLEDPRQVLRAQERKAKDAAMAAMKADGVEYEERLDRIAEVTYPRPLRELLFAAFDKYCESVPLGARLLRTSEIGFARHVGISCRFQGLHPEAGYYALRRCAASLSFRSVSCA